MDIRQSILEDRSKANILAIIDYIGDDRTRLIQLIKHTDDIDLKIVRRIYWTLSTLAKSKPGSLDFDIKRYESYFLKDLDQYDMSILRDCTKILEYSSLTEEIEGLIYERCLSNITNLSLDLAPRVFSITVALNIALPYVELCEELLEILKIISLDESAAIKSRSKRTLKAIKKHHPNLR